MKSVKFNGVGSMWPLHTKTDLSKRWGVSVQRLNNWAKRHDDFPPRIEGIMSGETLVYGESDVKHYEKTRGGAEKVAEHNSALGNR